MGQQQSMAPKGMGIPSFNLAAGDSRVDNSGPFSASQNSGLDQNSSSTSSASGSSGSGLTAGLAVDQSQSVRAAIDSFIETCLAGGSDEATSLSKQSQSTGPPDSVEVITVPDEDGSDDLNVDGADHESKGGSKSSGDNNIRQCESREKSPVIVTGTTDGCAVEKKADSVSVSTPAGGSSQQDGTPVAESSSSRDLSESVQNTDTTPGFAESGLASSSKPVTGSPSHLNEDRVNHSGNLSTEGNSQSKDNSDSSNSSSEGVESVRLKTLIDRVLDNSLGGSGEAGNIPLDHRILPQIVADEKTATSKPQTSESINKEDEASAGKVASDAKSDKKVEPVAICFMDHIEKAVERSFSTITEEEERREKEKLLAAQTVKTAENKNPSWSGRPPKQGDATSSVSSVPDGTISVQDIVDRVISQTEVISKLMTTSSGPSLQTESKPTVSASGTFYPDRAPAETSIVQNHSQHRRETHKEEVPRETTGRRGRPRMRSPCLDHRDSNAQDYHHGNHPRDPLMGRRGPSSLPSEDYIQSMQAALAKYGQVHPSVRMPPYLPPGIATAASVSQSCLPVSSVQNAVVMGGMHHPAQSLPPHQQLHHASHHAVSSAQPPPLLRVTADDRADQSHHPHQKHTVHPHPPSRSCGCAACIVYFGCKRDTDRARMLQSQIQGERSVPRMSPHSPHPAYQKSSTAAQSHSMKWPSSDVRRPDHKQERVHSQYPYASYPSQSAHGPDPYRTSHPAYGIQTGVHVPQNTYPEKQVTESRHSEPHYPKPYERPEYAHRRNKPGYEDPAVGEVGSGRHPYSKTMPAVKPVPGHSHPYAIPQPHHPHAHHHSGRKADEPVIDMTYRREATAPPSAYEEEDKPLDLSSKKPSSPAYFHERHDVRHHREEGYRFDNHDSDYDPAGRGVPYPDRPREGEKPIPPSQHLHSLETSVENYFQKFQQHGAHRGVPPHSISAGIPPQHMSGGLPPHNISAGVPPRNISAGVPPQNISAGVPPQNISVGRPLSNAGSRLSAVPLPPHHPALSSQHHSPSNHHAYNPTPQPGHTYSAEPLLSPGGRRPQLHPIPAPNPSTSLGSAASRAASGFQSRSGAPSMAAGAPSQPIISPVPTSNTPSMSSQMHNANVPVLPVPVSSPQRSGSSGSNPQNSDYLRPNGSRSVSPQPGTDMAGEDRRRGSVSKHEPIQNIIGNNNPQDILYLICRLCRQTYGSPYGFRKHFRNQHGFEPKAEHTVVQTISATKNARQMLGGVNPALDSGSPSHESYPVPHKSASGDGASYVSHSASPRPESRRSVTAGSPGSVSCESVGDGHSGEGSSGTPLTDHKHRGSFSRVSTESKGRSPSGSVSGGSVGDEREDTKCLECPECGQTFQLNDFGSYKRHCRQHGQMRGVHGGGGGSQGVHTCTECQCSFPEPHLLQEHMLRHQPHTTAVVCTVCRVSFSSPAECQEHMRMAHGSSSAEPTSSSSPVTVSAKSKTSSASSHSDISSTSSVKHEPACADSSMSSFNLTVTTPSDLEIRRLPADPIVTSASPDSSSDNKKAQENSSDSKKTLDGSPVSSSEQNKTETIKTEPNSLESPKPASLDGTDSIKIEGKESVKSEDDKDYQCSDGSLIKSRSTPTESSSSSSMDVDEYTDMYMYKHKKFSAHRKRSGSSETSGSEVKQTRLDTDSVKTEKTQQNVVSSASDKAQTKGQGQVPKTATEEKSATLPKPTKTEARHQMPFVWDRVTRSQAGKNAKSSDLS